MRNECRHGCLRRQCEICERDDRIAKLEHALRDLRDVILSDDNVFRSIGVREALDRAENLLSN